MLRTLRRRAETGGASRVRSHGGSDTPVVLWDRDGLTVTARIEAGSLVISGRDASGRCLVAAEEYRYGLAVPAEEVPHVLAALEGTPGDDVLELLLLHREAVVGRGELRWLESVGVRASFWTEGTRPATS